MRSFTYADGKSNKFWNIELRGSGFTVTFGKVGTAGQTQVKQFPDEAAARKEHDKLVAEKLRKGYAETTSQAPPPAAGKPGKRVEPAPVPELAKYDLSRHVTQFAGYPVREHDPAVGIVHAVMPRREFRPWDGKSDQLWAVSLEGDRLTVCSGTAGTEGESDARKFPTPEEAQAAYRQLVGEKRGAFVIPLVRREFHQVKGESHKVWEVTLLSPNRFHFAVRSGTIRPAGKAKVKKFDSLKKARDACKQLVAEQIAKGYTENVPEAGSLLEALYAGLVANPEDRASRMALADYLSEQGMQPHPVAYRVNEDEQEAFLADPFVGLVQALVIGWPGGGGPGEIVRALVNARDRLPHLRALFLGDIPYTEQEISWINQSDLTPLFTAFPRLEHFRARGGGGLALKPFEHANLRSLAFEASNLPREVVRAVGASRLPALEHLELWLGTEEYGADTTVADLKDLLAGKATPALRYLGLRNSEISDDIARALAGSPLLERLRVLDLSLGTLSDSGAEALLAIPALARLERLDLNHHYVSPALVDRLRAAGVPVDAGEPLEAEMAAGHAHRYVAHAE
jgi:predicted DNA-binding WGR domain protein